MNSYDIFDACSYNDVERVKYLISEGVDVNSKTIENFTPLKFAIINNHFELVKYLVENGADINHKDDGGYDAIMEASAIFDGEKILHYLTNQLKYQKRKLRIKNLLEKK